MDNRDLFDYYRRQCALAFRQVGQENVKDPNSLNAKSAWDTYEYFQQKRNELAVSLQREGLL